MGAAEQQTRHQAGLPDAAPARAEVLQQRLRDDATEQKFLRDTHQNHIGQKAQDAPERQQRAVFRQAEQDLCVERVRQQGQRIHSHQQAVEEAAAPLSQQLRLAGALQQQHGHADADQLLDAAQQIVVRIVQVKAEQHQQKHHKDRR